MEQRRQRGAGNDHGHSDAAASAGWRRAESAAVVTSSGTRYFLRQMVESSLPNLTVLSHNEIPPDVKVRSRGVIE